MQNKFEVTEEIYEYFKNRAVKINEIKKLIPNYMDYAKSEIVMIDDVYQRRISDELNALLNEERKIIKPNNLVDKIYDCFCDGEDNIGAKDFSIVLDDFSCFTVYSVRESNVTEQDGQVLTRLRNEIADYKLKRTNQLKVSKELLAIAENEELMQELLKLREQINVGKI